MKIGELARAGGVNVETIRFYQRRGLLIEPERGQGPRRYGIDDLNRLRSIRAAQTAGFTLGEIATLLALDTADRSAAHELANRRIDALDHKIATLQTMRGALVRLAEACAGDDAGPCPIITAFHPTGTA
ncbi:MerR family transcriptional regulator [Novosphingobium sediminis]|jgi:MerR family mercuric resistance operon transcriptional regulator|uniref:MerR family transcriptional regulator n=1 Tax=Novosphingobium sediminis TaxID=707214 RepID=A0A512AQP6_9SPHN|nr:MerR family transcriptional regulator [Novosphingobium sediminis]GEO02045.1 MerR family transcriptional regulator [Novosphingobium sediminis]